ncbi:unnamed protein product [Paramecium octaurelia]|uniref:Uncharacterized protein n=1 Tax=Paramecium octaurelia TaxID=43137 RepID=A0A8S1SFA7_PAROT|nr:unnamed protein product [Paramecium octaurelia]
MIQQSLYVHIFKSSLYTQPKYLPNRQEVSLETEFLVAYIAIALLVLCSQKLEQNMINQVDQEKVKRKTFRNKKITQLKLFDGNILIIKCLMICLL